MTGELAEIVSGVIGGMGGQMLSPVAAPFRAVSDVWTDRIKARIERTGERVARKRRGDGLAVTERTAVNALAAAALTDDPVVQEYLAGVVASASLENDNAHLLALVGRLTPVQLRLHYGLYLGAVMCVRGEISEIADELERWEEANDYNDLREMVTLITDPLLPRGREWDRAERALDNLRREGLVRSEATYWDSSEQGITSFKTTSFGIDLFAAALGIEIIGFGDLCECDLEVLQLEPVVTAMLTAPMEEFSRVYGDSDHDNAWARMLEARGAAG